MHFTNCGHTCWLEEAGERTAIHEDDIHSEAPLYALRLEVLAPLERADLESAICDESPLIIAVLDKFEEGMVVEIAALLRDTTLKGVRGVCSGRSEASADPITVVRRDGCRFKNLTKVLPKSMLNSLFHESDRSTVAPRGPECAPSKAMIETHNSQHFPYAPRCEICVQARGTSDWHVRRLR